MDEEPFPKTVHSVAQYSTVVAENCSASQSRLPCPWPTMRARAGVKLYVSTHISGS